MMESDMLHISVPGSTANLGPGFDSVGLALGCSLRLTAVLSKQWKFEAESKETEGLPEGKENLIYLAAEKAADTFGKEVPPCHVKVWSDIPLARGLGSSAAAIVGGIELANELCRLQLNKKDKTRIASLLEDHPDNAGASVYGGLVIGLHQEEETEIVHVSEVNADAVVIIPPYKVFTKDAREVLPSVLPFRKAVEASAISNLLVAAMMSGNWELAGKMMQKDLFHQTYRDALIPEYKDAARIAKDLGAYGSAISGAGPAIISFIEKGQGKSLEAGLRKEFQACKVAHLDIPNHGSIVSYTKHIAAN